MTHRPAGRRFVRMWWAYPTLKDVCRSVPSEPMDAGGRREVRQRGVLTGSTFAVADGLGKPNRRVPSLSGLFAADRPVQDEQPGPRRA